MIIELYPGMKLCACHSIIKHHEYLILGLDKVPQFLSDTLRLPQLNPDTSAQSTVLVQGGYDPCQYDEVAYAFLSC